MAFSKYISIILCFICLQSCNQYEKEKHFDEAIAYFKDKKNEESLKSFDKVISLDPSDYESWVFRGRVLHRMKRNEEAFASLNRAISIRPSSTLAYNYRARLYTLTDQPALGLLDINRVLKTNRKDTSALVLRAGIYLDLKQFDRSIEDCNTLLGQDPGNADAFFCRGTVLKYMGKKEEALHDFNAAIKLNPAYPIFYNDRAFILVDMERYDEAIQDYNKAIQLSGKDDQKVLAFAHNNRGFASFKTGNIPGALKDINYAIELFPENSYAFKNRALIYIKLKEVNKACQDIDRSLQLGYTKKYGDEVLKLQERHCK